MTDYGPLLGLAVVWVICGVICSLIWHHRGGNPMSGFWIGALAGVFGLVYVTVASPRTTSTVWNPAEAAVREIHGEPPPTYAWHGSEADTPPNPPPPPAQTPTA